MINWLGLEKVYQLLALKETESIEKVAPDEVNMMILFMEDFLQFMF